MLQISFVLVEEGLYCQYNPLAFPFCVNQFHSTEFQIELILSRNTISFTSVVLLKYCRAVSRPCTRNEVSTISAPLLFPKGTVAPVLPFIQCEKAPCQRWHLVIRKSVMVCNRVTASLRVIKPRLTAATIAMMPKPLPPVVTVSLSPLLRSLARPLIGWPKSQKYLKVCCCTKVSKALSEIRGNLSVESIAVVMVAFTEACNEAPSFDFKPVPTVNEYLVIKFSADEGFAIMVLSFSKEEVRETAAPLLVFKEILFVTVFWSAGAENEILISGEILTA